MKYAKNLIRRGLRSLGYDVTRRTPSSDHYLQLLKALQQFRVDFIFDVGANKGQFASEMRSVGYDGELLSFEPIAEAYEALAAKASKDPQWHLYERGAIGDADGMIALNVAANSVSSSVLPMLDSHVSAAADSAYVGSQMVPMFRLDSVSQPYVARTSRPFLKIDVQGFEWQALDGARDTLPRLAGILCEMSLVPLYEGQHLWMDMIRRLEEQGFTLWSVFRGFTDLRNGRTLQVDATFFRL